MSDYDYGNARLRAMKSRLLSRHELKVLAETGSLQGLIAALTKTAYQKSIEAALTRSTGMNCIDEALHNDLINTVGKISSFYSEEAAARTAIFFRAYDIYNLKTILRGLSKNVSSSEVIAVLLPVGELKIGMLRELTRLNNPREAIDLMASQSLPFVQPLLKLRAEHRGADVFEMELALDQWHFHQAKQFLRSGSESAESLSYALALEADVTNLLTVLRFVHDPRERDVLREKMGSEDIAPLFIEAGRIPIETLSTASKQDSISSAVDSFSGTTFESALRAGLEVHSRSSRLSDIEKQLRHYRLQRLACLIQKDPLGIGVVLGYAALKINEVGNIRWIAQGINLDLKADAIQAELEVVS
ncbi:MAG: V-type ATPase subunit [Chloroflexi bacterium]|nr:V-type ATPase subunit [Chloroflexota bacterium]